MAHFVRYEQILDYIFKPITSMNRLRFSLKIFFPYFCRLSCNPFGKGKQMECCVRAMQSRQPTVIKQTLLINQFICFCCISYSQSLLQVASMTVFFRQIIDWIKKIVLKSLFYVSVTLPIFSLLFKQLQRYTQPLKITFVIWGKTFRIS